MAGGQSVWGSSDSHTTLGNALETAGQEYKASLARLTNLIDEITRGDIQGDPANDLLAKFQAKQDTLKRLAQIIDEAEEYMRMQGKKFDSTLNDIQSGMR